MQKKAFSLLCILVRANQTVNIEIHSGNSTQFESYDCCCYGQKLIENYPAGKPGWAYSLPGGFTTDQSPTVQSYNISVRYTYCYEYYAYWGYDWVSYSFMNYYCACQPSSVIPNISTQVQPTDTITTLPLDWQGVASTQAGCVGLTPTANQPTILSSTALVPANIVHSGGQTQIKVTANSNKNKGVYLVEWVLNFPAPHLKTFTTTFQVTIGDCMVTSYSLSGCASLANYKVYDNAQTQSCITITQVPACGYDSLLSITGISSALISGTVTTLDTVNLTTYTTNNALATTYNFSVKATLTGYPTVTAPTSNFAVSLVVTKCLVTSYTLSGCANLADYTVLDPSRTDSCIMITQVPACGYNSQLSITGIPSALIAGTVTTLDTVNLTTYTASSALAATYNFAVTATLTGYPTAPAPTFSFWVSLVVKKCLLTSYALTGCAILRDYTVLDAAQTDSCIMITQVPACGYDSTVSMTGIPSALISGTVTTLDKVNLTTYTASNALAATYNFDVTATPSGYAIAPVPTSTFAVSLLVNKCVVNSYTLTGCSTLADYTVLDTGRTDSCIIITQVPACGYDSTLLIAGIPTSIMTGSVSSTTIVKLATYTADKSLAKTYTGTVTAYLSDYPYNNSPTAPHAVSIEVIDPCTTTTIPAQAPPIPTIGQFAGFTKAVGQIIFQDTVSTANALITGQTNYCGPIQWSFKINGAATNELTGTNTNGTIIYAPPKSINPGNKRKANLITTLTEYPSIFSDNSFDVITYTATLQTPKDQNYTISDRPKSFQIDTNTDFQPQSPQIPFNIKWQICYQMNPQVNLTYPLDTTFVQCSMDWVTYPAGQWQIFSTDNTIAQAKPYRAILLQSFPDFVFNGTTPTQFAQFNLNVTVPPVNLAPYLPGLISTQTVQQCLESPTVNWSYTLPTAIDAEGDPVTYNVTLNGNKIYYEESSKSLIQFGFYSQPKNETVLIELSDNHGNKVKYKMVLTFRCRDDVTPPIVAVETVAAKKVITAKITNVTDEGNVTITFSSNLKIPKVNLTDFPTLNVTVQGKLVPSLQLSIEPGVDTSQKYLEFSWTMIEFNTKNLTLNLNFTFPRMVSKNKIKDYLYAQINDDLLFSDRQGNTITQGYELQLKQIPKQKVTASGDQKAIGAVVSSTLTTAMAGNAVVQLLLSGSLSSLLGCLDQLQVMTHLQLMNLNYPQNSQVFYTYLINIIMMEPVSIDSGLVSVLKLDQTEPLSPNFAILSYSTLYPTRNLGFNCLWYMAFPTGLFVCWILRLAFKNCKNERKFIAKIRNKYLTNGLVLFLNSTYLCTCVSFCISTHYMRFDSLGNNVNSLFSVLLAFVIILFPIFVGVFYTQNSKKIVRQDIKFLQKWGSLIEPLNFKRRGRKVIASTVLSLMRKLILAATLVFAQDAPIIVTIFCCMIQVLIIIYFIGGLEPMKNKGDNKMLLLNETFVMLNIYCQICYTDFNGDFDATVTMGNVLILITVTNIAINILRMLYLSASTIFRKLKLYCLKRKHQKMIKARDELKRQVEVRNSMKQLRVYRKKQQGMLFSNMIFDRNEIIRSYAIDQELPQGKQLTLKKDQVVGGKGNLDGLLVVKAKGNGTTQKEESTLINVKPRFNTMQRRNNQLVPVSPTFGNGVPVSNVDRRARHNDFDTLTKPREQDQVLKARKADYNFVVQATMNEFRAKGKRRLQQEESQNIELQNNFFLQKELPVTDPKYIKWRDQQYIDNPSLRDFEP